MGQVNCTNSKWSEGRMTCVKDIKDSISKPTAVYNSEAVLSTNEIGDTKYISLRTDDEGNEVSIKKPINPKNGKESTMGIFCNGQWDDAKRSYTCNWQDSSGLVGDNMNPTTGLIAKKGGDDKISEKYYIVNTFLIAFCIVAIVVAFIIDLYELKIVSITATVCLIINMVINACLYKSNM